MKITHFYAYFGQKIYFKAITYQLKAFEKYSKRIKWTPNPAHIA